MGSFSRLSCLLSILVWLVCVPTSSSAQDAIKLGFMYPFSGSVPYYGEAAKRGADLAIDEINKAGGINGRKIAGVFADTRLEPETGVREATRLVNEEKVDALLGIVSSEVAKAVAIVAKDLRTPLIITTAMTPDVTGKECNAYTFRISQNVAQNLKAAASLAAELKTGKWTTLGPDYVFGYQCWEYFQKFLSEKRKDVTFAPKSDTLFISMNTKDWKPYIQKAMKLNADGILISLYGANLRDFITQASESGFFDGKREILMNLSLSTEVLYPLGGLMPKDLWLGGLYWFQAGDNLANKEFVSNYMAKHKVIPDHSVHGGYAGVKAYAAAAIKAGTTEKESVRRALAGLTVEIPAGTTTIRSDDHQAICNGIWGKTAGYDPEFKLRKLDPLKVFPGNAIATPIEETGCPRAVTGMDK